MELLATKSFSGRDISSASALGTYSLVSSAELSVNLYLENISGGGIYSVYLTKQRSGSGTIFQSPVSEIDVGSGVTNIYIQTNRMPSLEDDIINIYALGLGTDISMDGYIEIFDVSNSVLETTLSGLQNWIATEITDSVLTGEITQIKGNSWVIEIPDVVLDSNKQQFAVKRSYDSSDNAALLFINSITGLLRANGLEVTDSTKASLNYDSETLELTITVHSSITSELPVKECVYGIQSITSGSVVSEPYMGTFNIIGDVVNASE